MLRWVTTMPLVRDLETDWGNDEGYDRDTVLKSLYWYVIEKNRRGKEDFGIWVSSFEISTCAIDVFIWNIIRYFFYRFINMWDMKTDESFHEKSTEERNESWILKRNLFETRWDYCQLETRNKQNNKNKHRILLMNFHVFHMLQKSSYWKPRSKIQFPW